MSKQPHISWKDLQVQSIFTFQVSGAQEGFVGSFLEQPLGDHLPATEKDRQRHRSLLRNNCRLICTPICRVFNIYKVFFSTDFLLLTAMLYMEMILIYR